MTALLEMQGVRHAYQDRVVLEVGEFSIQPREIVGLIGPNGSGKSTFLKIAALVEECTTGQVYYQGEPVRPFHPQARSKVSLLTQEPYLLRRSVFENIAYGLKIRAEHSDLRVKIIAALDQVGLAPRFADRQWYELSGGEAQRVALAARLALRPQILLLDEPTASVDLQSAEKMREAIYHARETWQTALVIASHNRSWLDGIADRQLHLVEGRFQDLDLENIIYGPWQETQTGLWGKKISDGQWLPVNQRFPAHLSCAMPAHHLEIAGQAIPPTPHRHQLSGQVASLTLEKSSGRYLVRVVCADHCFVVHLSLQSLQQKKLFPGQSVYLTYKLDDIIWLN
jgi:tungstate transport system ATP-binding protein